MRQPWGEPLLHPELPALIRIAKERGFKVGLSSNLNKVKNLQEVIAAGPDYFRVSLSGSTNDAYQMTHRGGDIARVFANMRLLRSAIDTCGATTAVEVLYHVYLHNALSEYDGVKQIATELRFNLRAVLAYLMPYEKVVAYFRGELPLADRPLVDRLALSPEEMLEIVRPNARPERDCVLRTGQSAINHDGSVALCCATYTHPNIATSFLDLSLTDLQRKKYNDPLCGECMGLALDLLGVYDGQDEWWRIAGENIKLYFERKAQAARNGDSPHRRVLPVIA